MSPRFLIWLRTKTSIKFRIFLFTGIMVSVLYMITVVAMQKNLSATKHEKLDSLRFIANEILPSESGFALWRGRTDVIAEILKKVIDSTDISYVTIYDNKDEIFHQSGTRIESGDLIEISREVFRDNIVPEFDGFNVDNLGFSKESVRLGHIMVQIDESNVSAVAWSSFWQNYTFLMVTGLLVLPLAYLLAMSLIRPLKGIVKDLETFEAGDYGGLLGSSKYNDEYGAISDALQKAGRSIAAKTSELKGANTALLERTKQLEYQRDIAMEARHQADEANAKKNVFVSNITHELKTPLTGVVASIDLIEQSINQLYEKGIEAGLSRQQIKDDSRDLMQLIGCIELAKFSSSELETLIDEILMSIEDIYSDITLDLQPVDLVHSLNRAMVMHKTKAFAKGLDFELSMDSNDRVWVLADWTRVSQIINALLSNAVKFTEKGCIQVSIRILDTKAAASLHLEVIDQGVGISDDEKEHIFSLFHIGQDPVNKSHSGVGTGLALARHVCASLNGSLSLNSTVLGKGSSFSFSCNFDRCEAVNSVNTESRKLASEPNKYSGLKVLYVEDSSTNQMIFKEYCKTFGVELVIAGNGLNGLDKCQHQTFDGLVVDCYMPIMNGYQMVKALRGLGDTSFVVALTADNSKKNEEKCKQAGFNEFVTKPYTKEVFLRIMDMFLANKLGSSVLK